MNILVIKQTSLGDVLHASGHIRSIKIHYPNSKLFLLTATTSADIYKYNPWVDELILIDRYGIKNNWYKNPLWAIKEMRRAYSRVREQDYDIAFDLQGLARSVVFLYGAKARRKYVKGRWWGLSGFRNKAIHAIEEMDGVLDLAGIPTDDTTMEFQTDKKVQARIDEIIAASNPGNKPLLIMSPFSRWRSKDWPLTHYFKVCDSVSDRYQVLFTGSEERAAEINQGLAAALCDQATSLAGQLSLLEFVELTARADLMLTGDSFPMHVAGSKGTPVIALFGPTDERKVGPLGENNKVIRVAGCDICDKKNCARLCLKKLEVAEVLKAIREQTDAERRLGTR